MITVVELVDAIRRARAECDMEIHAAREEYNKAIRPMVEARRERSRVAREKRDAHIQTLRDEFSKSR